MYAELIAPKSRWESTEPNTTLAGVTLWTEFTGFLRCTVDANGEWRVSSWTR